jgi:nicotinamidase-related amidase
MGILSARDSLLVVIDIQERLLAVMEKKNRLLEKAIQLTRGIVSLEIPIIVTEQYPKGLGPTSADLSAAAGDCFHCEKTSFGCLAESTFQEQLQQMGKKQIIVCGIEAHICVHQTVQQLLADDYQVFLAADACGSREKSDYKIALSSMEKMGCRIGSCEMFLFELLQNASNPCFKTISAIIK